MPMIECPGCGSVQYAPASYVGVSRCSVCDGVLPVTKRQRDLAVEHAMRLPATALQHRRPNPHSTV